jgi:hypothetical protein
MSWYSVRCLFWHVEGLYEERVTLWRAESIDAAIQRAEDEAVDYMDGLNARYVGLAQAYGPLDKEPGDGVEVLSLMRASDLPGEDYVNRFFDTGTEAQQT